MGFRGVSPQSMGQALSIRQAMLYGRPRPTSQRYAVGSVLLRTAGRCFCHIRVQKPQADCCDRIDTSYTAVSKVLVF